MNEFLKSFAGIEAKAPLEILLAGITYPDTTYHIVRENSEFYVIEYVIDGEGYVFAEGELHKVCADTVYLLRPGERHNYYADEKNPFTKIFLNVSGSLCEQLLTAYGFSSNYLFDGKGVRASFERILEIISSELSESDMQAELQGIFVEILSRLSNSQRENKHSRDAVLLKNYLDSNLNRIVEAKELSRVIFRSEDYCQKLFLREFKSTPYAYQLKRKMQIAKSLLLNTRLPIVEIAQRLGYEDVHYFSNLFLKKCGTRPLNYRKGAHE